MDRIYLGAPDLIKLVDPVRNAAVLIRKHGFQDAVVWNPWIEKAQRMADFDDEGYKVGAALWVTIFFGKRMPWQTSMTRASRWGLPCHYANQADIAQLAKCRRSWACPTPWLGVRTRAGRQAGRHLTGPARGAHGSQCLVAARCKTRLD